MGEVSCRIVAQLLDASELRGVAPAELVGELPHDEAYLRDSRNHVSWDTLVALFDRLDARGFTLDAYETMGADIPRLPSAGFIVRLANAVVSARQLFLAGTRWLTPALYPIVDSSVTELPDGRMEIRLDVPRERPGCAAFFHVNKGVVVAGPELLGLPWAEVEAEIGSHGAVFRCLPPVEQALWPRLKLRARAAVSSWSLVDELGRKQDQIRTGYQALVRARRDFRQVIEVLPVLVAVTRGRDVVYVNPAFRACLGCDAAQLAERGGLLALAHPEDRGALVRQLEAPSDAVEVLGRELGFVNAAGREVLLEVAPPQRIHFDDEPAQLFVARDVTERRRLEHELERADRLAALGRLVASVGHELNNPLSYVSLHLHRLNALLPTDQHSAKSAQVSESLRAASEGIERARSVVADLVTFIRGAEQEAELLDLREVVDASAELVGKQIEQCGRLMRHYQGAPTVLANRSRLEQVVVNLLLNAAQSFGDRPREKNEIQLRVDQAAPRTALVEVTDNGAGMSAEVQAQLFRPFFTTRPNGEGTGLGLTICHEIVTKLGGDIDVTSEPGRGTTFVVRLPAETGTADASPRPPAAPPPSTVPRARVLLVDDERNLIQVLCALLVDEGHRVTVAHSGSKALELLARSESYDLILCDLMMQDVSGMELYAQVRRDHPSLAARVVFMTGGAFTDEAQAFLDQVGRPWLQKPFDFDLLLDHVKRSVTG